MCQPLVPGKVCHCVNHLYLGRSCQPLVPGYVSATCTWEGVSLCQPLVPREVLSTTCTWVCVSHLYLGRCVTVNHLYLGRSCQPLVPGYVSATCTWEGVSLCQPLVPREVLSTTCTWVCVSHLYLGRCVTVSTTCSWEGVCQPLVPGKVCHCVKHLYLGKCMSTTFTWEGVLRTTCTHTYTYTCHLYLGRCVTVWSTCTWVGVCQALVPRKVCQALVPGKVCHCVKHLFLKKKSWCYYLPGMELKVGSNIMISLCILLLLIRHMHFIFFVYVYIVSCYIRITFVNIITLDYFVLI